METAEDIRKEIQRLQNRLAEIEKTQIIKRPVGNLTYSIYHYNGDNKFDFNDEMKWVKKLISMVKKSQYLFVQYHIKFDFENKKYEDFFRKWENPTENDINDFLKSVYSANRYIELSSIIIGISDKNDCIVWDAYVHIPSFENFEKQVEKAKMNKDNSFFEVMDNWRLEYR